MEELSPALKAQGISFLIDIGRWAASELRERWTLARKEQGTRVAIELQISGHDDEVQAQAEILMQFWVQEYGVAEVKRVLHLIERKRGLIYEWKECKLDNEEEYSRQRIARSALRLMQKDLDQKISNALADVETHLRELGIEVKKAIAD